MVIVTRVIVWTTEVDRSSYDDMPDEEIIECERDLDDSEVLDLLASGEEEVMILTNVSFTED